MAETVEKDKLTYLAGKGEGGRLEQEINGIKTYFLLNKEDNNYYRVDEKRNVLNDDGTPFIVKNERGERPLPAIFSEDGKIGFIRRDSKTFEEFNVTNMNDFNENTIKYNKKREIISKETTLEKPTGTADVEKKTEDKVVDAGGEAEKTDTKEKTEDKVVDAGGEAEKTDTKEKTDAKAVSTEDLTKTETGDKTENYDEDTAAEEAIAEEQAKIEAERRAREVTTKEEIPTVLREDNKSKEAKSAPVRESKSTSAIAQKKGTDKKEITPTEKTETPADLTKTETLTSSREDKLLQRIEQMQKLIEQQQKQIEQLTQQMKQPAQSQEAGKAQQQTEKQQPDQAVQQPPAHSPTTNPGETESNPAGRESESESVEPESSARIASTPAQKKHMTWDEIPVGDPLDIPETINNLRKFLKEYFSDNYEEFRKDYEAHRDDKYKNNKFIEELGGIDNVIDMAKKEDLKRQASATKVYDAGDSFAAKTGFKPKTAEWYSLHSYTNKRLYYAEQRYNKNVNIISKYERENENLRKQMDPFENKYSDSMSAAIQSSFHLKGNRKKAGKLFDEMRSDCVKDFLGIKDGEKPTKEQEELFSKLTPEEKTTLFKNFLDEHKGNEKYRKHGKKAMDIVSSIFEKRSEKSFKKIATNNEVINAKKNKNNEIIEDTKDMVDKKKAKIQYRKDKETYKKLKRENTAESIVKAGEMAQKLKEQKEKINEKSQQIKKSNVRISRNTFKTSKTVVKASLLPTKKREELANNLRSLNFDSATEKLKNNGSKTKTNPQKQQQNTIPPR